MSDPVARAGAAPRLLRAAVFTAVCVVLSATGHVLAACAPVPWWTLLLGFLGVFAAAAPLAGRTRSTATVVASLTGGQLVLHSLFSLGQQRMVMPAGTDSVLVRVVAKFFCGAGSGSLSHLDAGRIAVSAGVAPTGHLSHQHMNMGPGTSPMAADGWLPSLPMVLGHLLAALATGWLLRRGDLALLRLARLSAHGIGEITDNAQLRALRAALALVQALLAGLPDVPVPASRAPRPLPDAPPAPAGEVLHHTVIRRGPPADFALAA
jgi:hypothetical protein